MELIAPGCATAIWPARVVSRVALSPTRSPTRLIRRSLIHTLPSAVSFEHARLHLVRSVFHRVPSLVTRQLITPRPHSSRPLPSSRLLFPLRPTRISSIITSLVSSPAPLAARSWTTPCLLSVTVQMPVRITGSLRTPGLLPGVRQVTSVLFVEPTSAVSSTVHQSTQSSRRLERSRTLRTPSYKFLDVQSPILRAILEGLITHSERH